MCLWGSSQGPRDDYADDGDGYVDDRAIVPVTPVRGTQPRVEIGNYNYTMKPDSFKVNSVGASLYESI